MDEGEWRNILALCLRTRGKERERAREGGREGGRE